MPDRKIKKSIIDDLKPARSYLWWGALFYVPVTVLSVIQPLIIGYTVQHGMTKDAPIPLGFFAALFAFVIIALATCELLQGFALQTAGQIFVKNLRKRAFDKVQKLSMGFLDATPLGRVLTRLTNDAESVTEMFSMGAVQIFGDMLFLVGTFIMLLVVDVSLSFYSTLILPVLALGIYFFRLWTKKAYVRVREVLSNLNSFLQEYLSGIATVQTAGRVKLVHKEFMGHNETYLLANQRAVLLDAAIYSFVDAVSYAATALVLWGAFRLKLDHALSLGVLVAFLEALSRFFQPVRELSNRYAVFQSALVSLERMYDLFDWPEETDTLGDTVRPFMHQIEFKNVRFSYLAGEEVLKGVSFTVPKDKLVALVGPTGAGKSSVIKLLNHFYTVNDGAILIDGENINHIPLGRLRRLISVVPQEVFLFHGTLRENLCFGKPDATDEMLWAALETTQLKQHVQERGGLEAIVLRKGANFSLGERQLLAIARALVMDPPVLILDEATASVDNITENKLQKATTALLKRRTSLVIAHRLPTVKHADLILVFNHGRIAEQGTHQTLMQQDGIYAGLVKLQDAL